MGYAHYNADASIYGGRSVGGRRFYVDGDFSIQDPEGLPSISTPFTGDTILATNDIILLSSDNVYVNVPLGEGYNIQPQQPNQASIIAEQNFIVAQQAYVPMLLNTRYNMAWCQGWENTYAYLADAILVEEGALEDIGGGFCRIKRTFAVIPPSRSVPETYPYQFPGMAYNTGAYRPAFVRTVASRLQSDFFLWDAGDNAPQFQLFPNGPRLDQTTGMNPVGLILQEQHYYGYVTVVGTNGNIISENAVANNIFLPSSAQLTDPSDPTDPNTGSIPSTAQYLGWVFGESTSNGLPAEIVAETSCLKKWRGNIYERVTRFVVAI